MKLSFFILFMFCLPGLIVQAYCGDRSNLVAEVGGRKILEFQLKPSELQLKVINNANPNQSIDQIKQNYIFEKLFSLLLSPLRKKYIKSHGIEATKSEISACLDIMKRDIEKLEDNNPSKVFFSQPEYNKLLPALARYKVNDWKFKSHIYKQTGGRIFLFKGDDFPIDAYKEFFENNKKAGLFEIYDPGLRKRFWRFLSGNDSLLTKTYLATLSVPLWNYHKAMLYIVISVIGFLVMACAVYIFRLRRNKCISVEND